MILSMIDSFYYADFIMHRNGNKYIIKNTGNMKI